MKKTSIKSKFVAALLLSMAATSMGAIVSAATPASVIEFDNSDFVGPKGISPRAVLLVSRQHLMVKEL